MRMNLTPAVPSEAPTSLLTYGQVARLLHVSRRHVWALVNKKHALPGVRQGGHGVRIRRRDLIEFVSQRTSA